MLNSAWYMSAVSKPSRYTAVKPTPASASVAPVVAAAQTFAFTNSIQRRWSSREIIQNDT